jgi:hypothetical protein
VLANTIAAVVVVLVAALILPTHATEEVRPTYIPLATFLKQLHRYCALLRAFTTIVPSTQQVHGEWYTDGCHQQSLYNTAEGLLLLAVCMVLQVQTSIADVLLHSGAATSRYAGRLFRPAPAAPNQRASSTVAPPAAKSAMQQPAPANSSSHSLKIGSAFAAAISSDWASAASTVEPGSTAAISTADTEAAAEAALAAADSLIQQLAAIDVEEGSSVGGYDARVAIGTRLEGGEQPVFEPLPFLVMKEAHTEEE